MCVYICDDVENNRVDCDSAVSFLNDSCCCCWNVYGVYEQYELLEGIVNCGRQANDFEKLQKD